MLKQIFDRYDKQLLAALPRALFDGHIEVIVSESAAEKAVRFLLGQPLRGFDTETRPSFVQGRMNKVALLQVCSGSLTSEKGETCFLFRLNRFGLTDALVRLFTSERIQKVGLSLHDDWAQLRKRKEFKPVNFIELQDYVKPLGVVDMSLQKLYANFFGQKISKTQRLTNWEADVLTEAQKRYAATDAWTCLRLYDIITELFNTHAYRLVLVPEPETSKS